MTNFDTEVRWFNFTAPKYNTKLLHNKALPLFIFLACDKIMQCGLINVATSLHLIGHGSAAKIPHTWLLSNLNINMVGLKCRKGRKRLSTLAHLLQEVREEKVGSRFFQEWSEWLKLIHTYLFRSSHYSDLCGERFD